jgi:hypothetical protein
MNKIILIIAIIAVIVVGYFVVIPYVITPLIQGYFWTGPIEKKQQDILNFQRLCEEWNTTSCSGNPSDDLCKAAVGKIATTYFPLNTKKCSDVSDEAITILRTACCE